MSYVRPATIGSNCLGVDSPGFLEGPTTVLLLVPDELVKTLDKTLAELMNFWCKMNKQLVAVSTTCGSVFFYNLW